MIYEELKQGNPLQFTRVRKFVVDFLQLDTIEIVLFSAFEAPLTDPFYLNPEDAQMVCLKQHIETIEVDDYETYKWRLRFLLDTITASGAAVFRGLEQDNILA